MEGARHERGRGLPPNGDGGALIMAQASVK